MQTIRVWSKATRQLLQTFTGVDCEKKLQKWLNGRPESDFTILR
jgi:hypothetical protein